MEKVRWLTAVCASAVLIGSCTEMAGNAVKTETERQKTAAVQKYIPPVQEEFPYRQVWEEMRKLNSDYAGWLRFADEMISEPVVHGKDRSYYLDHWIDGTEGLFGTVFMDPDCTADSLNITLYGHHVFDQPDVKFGPLLRLIGTGSARFDFYLENEQRTYETVYAVCLSAEEEAELPFCRPGFEEDVFARYISYLEENDVLQTGNRIEYGTPMITMQTCMDPGGYTRLLVIAKETGRTSFCA